MDVASVNERVDRCPFWRFSNESCLYSLSRSLLSRIIFNGPRRSAVQSRWRRLVADLYLVGAWVWVLGSWINNIARMGKMKCAMQREGSVMPVALVSIPHPLFCIHTHSDVSVLVALCDAVTVSYISIEALWGYNIGDRTPTCQNLDMAQGWACAENRVGIIFNRRFHPFLAVFPHNNNTNTLESNQKYKGHYGEKSSHCESILGPASTQNEQYQKCNKYRKNYFLCTRDREWRKLQLERPLSIRTVSRIDTQQKCNVQIT